MANDKDTCWSFSLGIGSFRWYSIGKYYSSLKDETIELFKFLYQVIRFK